MEHNYEFPSYDTWSRSLHNILSAGETQNLTQRKSLKQSKRVVVTTSFQGHVPNSDIDDRYTLTESLATTDYSYYTNLLLSGFPVAMVNSVGISGKGWVSSNTAHGTQ